MRDEHEQELDARTHKVESKLMERIRSVEEGLKGDSANLQTELNTARGEQEALVCKLQREMKRGNSSRRPRTMSGQRLSG
jgi:hypothetical protein